MASLDQEALARLRRTMGSEAEFRDMLQEFLAASSRLLGDLQRAGKAAHANDAERAAHTLKSMARMVGAVELAEACAGAEAMHAPLPASTTEELAGHLERAQLAVRQWLA